MRFVVKFWKWLSEQVWPALQSDHWRSVRRTIAVVVALSGVAAIIVTAFATYGQSRAMKQQSQALARQVELARTDTKAQQLIELGKGLSEDSSLSRTTSLYGLIEYTSAFPESRRQILQILAAYLHSEDLPGFEKSIAEGVLRSITQLPNPEEVQLSFDLSHLRFGRSMSGMRAENAFFFGTSFEGLSLASSAWECVDATGLSANGSDLRGAKWKHVSLNDARLRTQTVDDATAIEGYWDDGHEPKVAGRLTVHRLGTTEDYVEACASVPAN